MGVDLRDDRFDVVYDAGALTPEDLLATVKKLGFDPDLVATPNSGNEDKADAEARLDLTRLPDDIRALFNRAREQRKLVLLRFSGPG